MSPKYICLCNPHSSEWLVFHYKQGVEKYAPNYGTPLTNGTTPEEAIEYAEDMWGIDPDDVEVCY